MLTPHDITLLLLAAGAIGAVILLIARFKLHPFPALMICALGLGLAAGRERRPGTQIRYRRLWRHRRQCRHRAGAGRDVRRPAGEVARCGPHRLLAHHRMGSRLRALGDGGPGDGVGPAGVLRNRPGHDDADHCRGRRPVRGGGGRRQADAQGRALSADRSSRHRRPVGAARPGAAPSGAAGGDRGLACRYRRGRF